MLFKKKIKNSKIIGTRLTLYSISWIPNPCGNIDVTLSLKYFSFGFKKKDKKNVFVKEIKEWNSVAGYFLGKLFKKNKAAVIFDNEIEIPKNKDKVNLKKIFKLLTKCE